MLNPVERDHDSILAEGASEAPEVSLRLGEILISRGKLDLANLDRALKVQETARQGGAVAEKLGSVLSRLGMLSSRELPRRWRSNVAGLLSRLPSFRNCQFSKKPLLHVF